MGQDDRERTFVLRASVDEVDPDAVQGCAKLRERVQRPFRAPPIIVPSPVVGERANLCQRYTLGPVRYGFLVRPASSGESPFQIVQRRPWHMHLKRCDVLGRRRQLEQRSLLGALLGPNWRRPRCQQTGTTGYGSGTYELTARAAWRRCSCFIF